MSDRIYVFTVGVGNREVSESIDLIDDLGWDESDFYGMTEGEILDMVYKEDFDTWASQHSYRNIRKAGNG